MKLFEVIVIATLVSLPGLAFSQATPENETTTESLPVEVKEKESVGTVSKIPVMDEKLPKKALPKKVEEKVEPTINGLKTQTDIGYLLSIDEDELVIDLGSNDGLKPGEAVEFFEIQKKGFGDEEVTVLKPITLGQVLEVTKKHARVHIPINVVVPIGSAVKKVGIGYWESKMNRAKPTGTELALTVRPFIPLDTFGAGAVIDFEATHRFDKIPLALSLVLSPIAFAITDHGNPSFMTAYIQASYDSKYFEIGLGIGGAKTFDYGVSATQYLRVGTNEGLNLKVTTALIGIDKFEFHGVKVVGQVPIESIFKNTWIVGRASFHDEGRVKLGYGELGVRTLVRGRGASGSVFLTPFLGGVGISETTYSTGTNCNVVGTSCTMDYAGPSVGLTIEWRP